MVMYILSGVENLLALDTIRGGMDRSDLLLTACSLFA